jgi:hypothetical protein
MAAQGTPSGTIPLDPASISSRSREAFAEVMYYYRLQAFDQKRRLLGYLCL